MKEAGEAKPDQAQVVYTQPDFHMWEGWTLRASICMEERA